MNKTSYPNINDTMISGSYNILKWTNAFHEIYSLANYSNMDFSNAFNKITEAWGPVEKLDFKHWIKFYQEQGQNKYKMAQIAFEALKGNIPMPPDLTNSSEYKDQLKKNEIDRKIKSLLSRITAAERIATDADLQSAILDKKWFETLHELKRQIQLAPLRNIKSSLLEDIIIKHANILEKQGYSKAANEIAKLSQNVPAPKAPEPPKAPEAPKPSAPKPLNAPVNKPNLPAKPTPGLQPKPPQNEFGAQETTIPSLPEAVESPVEKSSGEQALDEFINGLNVNTDVNDADISVVAQQQFEQPKQNIPRPAEDPVLEVVEEEHLASKPDDLIESALDKVTIHDVIAKLEIIANILRTRELPRQFAISDLMMDKLGISSFFPALAEASSKTLDANQYALTRIEDILSKLRGVVKTAPSDQIDLTGNDQVNNFLVSRLKEDQRKEQEKKDQKQKEQQVAEQVLKPLETQELKRPVNIK